MSALKYLPNLHTSPVERTSLHTGWRHFPRAARWHRDASRRRARRQTSADLVDNDMEERGNIGAQLLGGEVDSPDSCKGAVEKISLDSRSIECHNTLSIRAVTHLRERRRSGHLASRLRPEPHGWPSPSLTPCALLCRALRWASDRADQDCGQAHG